MIFSTATFLAFLVVVLIAVAAARSELQRRGIVFAASLFFYGWWDWRFCFFLVAASTIDYYLALAIQHATGSNKRRWLLLSLLSNLGLLATFKYFGWVVRNINALTGLDLPSADLPLPLGISFFTFQAMSYTIDVYRGSFDPTRRWFDFAFSMTFFPHLIAGPIVRAAHFMPQLAHPHPLQGENLLRGSERFAKGFIKKTLIADQVAVLVDPVFLDPSFYSSPTVWLAVVAYTAQIYYDFSGYTDMAIGLARMFGFEFPRNFEHPYLAGNITDFWRRWHISLSSWLRDYLYVSLGGNRRGRARTYLNLLLTMLLGGLWHGANWTFVAWGALHGGALAIHKAVRSRWPVPGTVAKLVGPPTTLLFVMLCWVFFRATSFDDAWVVLRKMSFIDAAGVHWPHVQTLVALATAVAAHAVIASGRGLEFDFRKPIWVTALVALLMIDLLFAPKVHSPFIYFQF